MNRQEYIEFLRTELIAINNDYRFNNYKNQIEARKISADFIPSYSENYLWNHAIFLSTNGCILLNQGVDPRLALSSLKRSAEVFESLNIISENYDRDYCIILSALCYDLSGYQANALCLVKSIQLYSVFSEDQYIDLSADNYIVFQIQQILLKKISAVRSSLRDIYLNQELGILDTGVVLFNNFLENWCNHLLNGEANNYYDELEEAYKYYSNDANIYISHLLFLLRSRVNVYSQRSIWNNLLSIDEIKENTIWLKFIKLLTHDIYDGNEIKNLESRISKFEFWMSQIRAIEKGIFTDENNFVIQMPTSAGKTFIAELVILDSLIKHPDKKCLYIAPFRALSNQKESELSTYLSKLGYSVSALSGSYEFDEFQEIVLEDTDVLIATPEKIDFLFRQNPEYFSSVSLMVIDEGHIVGDISSRASLLEFLIIRLKIYVRNLKTLFISAVMPPENADDYSVWLNGRKDKVIRSLLFSDSPIEEEWEPTRKLIGRFDWSNHNGRITYRNMVTENEETKISVPAFVPSIIQKFKFNKKFPDGSNKAQTSASLAFELSTNGNCLVFCAQVRETERVAIALLNILGAIEEEGTEIPVFFKQDLTRESYFFSKKWFGENSHISKCLAKGIGIHYGDMPEAVRRSVETDYISGNLRILISTNTIGQGLNFPIKHLIIHSTIITPDEYISVRDFWNIIGRAGRAGKETEGQIIFVIKSPTDVRSYIKYTNKSKIEKANSMLFNILDALVKKRITSLQYEGYIESVSESYLLNLIAEEIIETDEEKQIELIIENSLFKIQAEKEKIDIEPLRNSFRRIIKNIKEEVPPDILHAFGATGFILKSNKAISDFIDAQKENLIQAISDDNFYALLKFIFELFSSDEIVEVKSEKIDRTRKKPSDFFNVTKMWMEGKEIEIIQEEWKSVSQDPNHLNILISDGFYYRYAWGVTAFITILLSKFELDLELLPTGVKSLSSYIKFGVDNPTACLARSLGIKNRDVALFLSERANNLSGRDFIKWLSNLPIEEIDSFKLNPFDQKNVISTSLKLTGQRFRGIPDVFEFDIKGVEFSLERTQTSKNVVVGEKLNYKRELLNQFDPFAILVLKDKNELGYIPREISKLLSVEIDINQTNFEIEVTDVVEGGNLNSILVKMKKTK